MVLMFTGVLPWEHGAWANKHHGYALGESIPVLMESDRYAGWAKGAFVSAYPAGPEGGLTDLEFTAASTEGSQLLQLGPRVLRTETAPATALSVLSVFWGEMPS